MSGVIVGGYLGSFWGGSLSQEVMLSGLHPHEKKIYSCGIKGNVECFINSYKDIAVINATQAGVIINMGYPGLNEKKLKEIEGWNLKAYEELSNLQP